MRIKSHALRTYVSRTVAGLLVLGMPGIFIVLVKDMGPDAWIFYLATAPFLLGGALLALFGARDLLHVARVGNWQLDVPGQSLVFGRPVDVTLFPDRERTLSAELNCHLRCVRIIRHPRHGGGYRTSEEIVWEESWAITAATRIHSGFGIRLRLPLPEDGLPTRIDDRDGSGIQWQLTVIIPSARMGRPEKPVFELSVRASGAA